MLVLICGGQPDLTFLHHWALSRNAKVQAQPYPSHSRTGPSLALATALTLLALVQPHPADPSLALAKP